MTDRWVWDDLNTRKENEQAFIEWHQKQPPISTEPEYERTERQQSFLEWMGL